MGALSGPKLAGHRHLVRLQAGSLCLGGSEGDTLKEEMTLKEPSQAPKLLGQSWVARGSLGRGMKAGSNPGWDTASAKALRPRGHPQPNSSPHPQVP